MIYRAFLLFLILIAVMISPAFGAVRHKPARVGFVIRHLDAGGYEVRFPGTDLLPVSVNNQHPLGMVSRDKIEIRPGVVAKLVPAKGKALLVISGPKAGAGQTIDFSADLMNDAMWGRSKKEANDLRYLVQRGNLSPDTYQFFGLAKAHGKVYLGVVWYSPSDSFEPRGPAMVYELGWSGKQVKPSPMMVTSSPFASYESRPWPPFLEALPSGDLVLFNADGILRLATDGSWKPLPFPPGLVQGAGPAEKQLEQWTDLWLRGDWLVAAKRDSTSLPQLTPGVGRTRADTTLEIFDISTGRQVERAQWTTTY